MARQKPEAAQVTWADVAEALGTWQAHYGIEVEARIGWRANLTAGAFVEVVLREGGVVGTGVELLRLREAFPTKRMTGQAGAVLWAISSALRALEVEPWSWSRKMRQDALK